MNKQLKLLYSHVPFAHSYVLLLYNPLWGGFQRDYVLDEFAASNAMPTPLDCKEMSSPSLDEDLGITLNSVILLYIKNNFEHCYYSNSKDCSRQFHTAWGVNCCLNNSIFVPSQSLQDRWFAWAWRKPSTSSFKR